MPIFDTMSNAIEKIEANTHTTVDCSAVEYLVTTPAESHSLCNALKNNTVLEVLYLPCLSRSVLWQVIPTLFKLGSPLRLLSFGSMVDEPWCFCFEVDPELRRLKITVRMMRYYTHHINPMRPIFTLLGTHLATDTRFRQLYIQCRHIHYQDEAAALLFKALEQNKALEFFEVVRGDMDTSSREALIRLVLSPNRTLKTLVMPCDGMSEENLMAIGEALKKTPRQSGLLIDGIELYRVAASLGFGHCETNQRVMDAMLESWRQKLLALAMGTHPRLGVNSPVCACDDAMSEIFKLYWEP